MTDLHKSLKALNDAAYAATRAASATGNNDLYHRLRSFAFEIDKMVDANAAVIERGDAAALRARQMNAELPADQRDVLLAKGMV